MAINYYWDYNEDEVTEPISHEYEVGTHFVFPKYEESVSMVSVGNLSLSTL